MTPQTPARGAAGPETLREEHPGPATRRAHAAWIVLYGCGHWAVECGPPMQETTPRVCSQGHSAGDRAVVGRSPQGLALVRAAYVDLDAPRISPDEHWPEGCIPFATRSVPRGWWRRDCIAILANALEEHPEGGEPS